VKLEVALTLFNVIRELINLLDVNKIAIGIFMYRYLILWCRCEYN